jgi:8-oxo-dGTP pyrophosphatase MutT (NUDIX family)
MMPEFIEARLAAARAADAAIWGDDLERQERLARTHALRDAAVLIPLVARPDGPRVLLTQRTIHLHDHGGQISFPGGRRDAHDADLVATALRETHEETGVPASAVRILGQLPPYHTASGYRVTPVVGWLTPPLQLLPDPFEVADIFEVPCSFLLDPANQHRETAWVAGRERRYWAMPFREADGQRRYIWGVTAGILVMLTRIVREEPADA